MLVKLTDIKDKTYFINPLYVKGVAERKPGITEVYVNFGSMLDPKFLIKVSAPAEEVAAMISSAMPAGAEYFAPIVDQEEQYRRTSD